MDTLKQKSLLDPNIPLSLYIHIPWCVRKCPYCDFNSHEFSGDLPEKLYIDALLADFREQLPSIKNREIYSIFIGGGTPSLIAPEHYQYLLTEIQKEATFSKNIEITLEANPGTVEQARFQGFLEAGINRLSIGVQSFQDTQLKKLGRIHDAQEAIKAINIAQWAGFNNINVDLMYGLSQQSIADALADLETAISLNPKHISWYQLTIEPNTYFYTFPPKLPEHDLIWEMQQQGQHLLSKQNFKQYEVSAYGKDNFQCQHNLNYWTFGDYLAIGAGAHGKISAWFKNRLFWVPKYILKPTGMQHNGEFHFLNYF